MSDFLWLTIVVWIVLPILAWIAGYFGDRNFDNGITYGCCGILILPMGAWFVQALYELIGPMN